MQQIVFFHGIPGSPEDRCLLRFPEHAAVEAPNLAMLDPMDPLGSLFKWFDSFSEGKGRVHVVGFSLGALAALQLAAARSECIARVALISPGAPLQLGSFLSEMAGRPVFEAALSGRRLVALSLMQGMLSRIAPRTLIGMMLAGTAGDERALLADGRLRPILKAAFANCFRDGRSSYRAWLKVYVEDWTSVLDDVICPVAIWQGEKDTWVPPRMSEALQERLPGPVAMHRIPGAGHYSAMTHCDLSQHCPGICI